MTDRPIGPTAHGIIDYAFVTLNALAPSLFGLKGPAEGDLLRAGGVAGSHQRPDGPPGRGGEGDPAPDARRAGDAVRAGDPAVAVGHGALRHRNARIYFGSFFAIAAANYLLTNYNAYEPTAPRPTWQKALAWGESELA